MTKQFIATLCILAVVGVGVGVGAQGANEAPVSATVTAELITISVASGSVTYGILPTDTNEDTVSLSQTQVVTNDSNVAVDLEVKSSDAAGGTPWNLAATNEALDEFTHEFAPDGSTWAMFDVNNDIYTSLAGNIAASTGTQDLDLKIKTPSSVSDNTQKTIIVTVLATKYTP